MSKARSPRDVCSTTIGTRFIALSHGQHLFADKARETLQATSRLPRKLPAVMRQRYPRSIAFDAKLDTNPLLLVRRRAGMPGKFKACWRIPGNDRSPLRLIAGPCSLENSSAFP